MGNGGWHAHPVRVGMESGRMLTQRHSVSMPPGASRDGGDKKRAASRWTPRSKTQASNRSAGPSRRDVPRAPRTAREGQALALHITLPAFSAKEDAEAAEAQQRHRRRLGRELEAGHPVS